MKNCFYPGCVYWDRQADIITFDVIIVSLLGLLLVGTIEQVESYLMVKIMSEDIINNLGPLAPLAGIWQGDKGVDVSRIRSKETVTKYREEAAFEPMGPVNNGPQKLYGLRYSMTAWPITDSGGSDDAFHEELGYWLWDKENGQVLKSLMVPRGVVVNAGGCVDADSTSFRLEAECGSETYGVMSNKFLDETYKTKNYSVDITIHDDGRFSYKQDTQLWIPVNQAIFHHTDENTLEKVE